MNTTLLRNLPRALPLVAAGLASAVSARADDALKAWTARAPITLAAPPESAPTLVRLHAGNFDFSGVRPDGADLRFVTADGATVLPHRVERFDSLLGEAFVWVKAPAGKDGAPASLFVYYGNPTPPASAEASVYPASQTLVWHFAETGAPVHDWTGNGLDADAPAVPVEGALIGAGARFDGVKSLGVPASPKLEVADRGALTVALWARPAGEKSTGVLYSRRAGGDALVLGLKAGVPYVEVVRGGKVARAEGPAPLEAGQWRHLALVASGDSTELRLDGAKVASAAVGAPALKGAARLGGDTREGVPGFVGEMDEFSLASVAVPEAEMKAMVANRGPDGAASVTVGSPETTGGDAGGEDHAGYFRVIVDSLTFDGWVVIGLLAVMSAGSWALMVAKVRYLNEGARGNRVFMRGWNRLLRNLHAIDHGDHGKVESMGGILDAAECAAVKKSPIYRIFAVGAEEVRHRVSEEGSAPALTAESIEAIRARLDSAMVRETQRLDRLIVILTISISGGPFLGLLGTVVGVMITFAAVAMAGDVNVNAIAPGISAALLATVAGLGVAIPALFGYNYILGRIKDIKADMQVFIDEFITGMAEFYQPEPEGARGASASEASIARLVESLEAHRRGMERLHARLEALPDAFGVRLGEDR